MESRPPERRRRKHIVLQATSTLSLILLLSTPALAAESGGAEAKAPDTVDPVQNSDATDPVEDSAQVAATQELLKSSAAAHQEHCTNPPSTDLEVVSQKFATIGSAWSQVNERYTSLPDGPLLYWRGKLALCLAQQENGTQDLQQFIALDKAGEQWPTLVADATQQLEKLNISVAASTSTQAEIAESTTPKPKSSSAIPKSSVGLSIGLGGASVASFIIAGVQWEQALGIADQIHSARHVPDEAFYLFQRGEQHASAARVLVGVGAGLAVGAAISLVAGVAAKTHVPTSSVPPVIVPTENGAALVWHASW